MSAYFSELVKPGKFSAVTGFVAALLAVVTAGIILAEKLQLAANSEYVTSCSFNAVVSCSPVMSSEQAAAFWGIPNPILGLIGFSVVACLYFLSLFVKIPRFVWVVNMVGSFSALVFCFWLATQALFVIEALCLYCSVVWVLTSVLAWFSVKPLLVGTRFSEWQYYVKLGLIVTVLSFGVMIFVAFQDFWLSFIR